MSSVHLASGDLLLGRRHDANVERLGAAGARAHHGRQGHGAVLHLPGPVKLLLQDGGSGKTQPTNTQLVSSCKRRSASCASPGLKLHFTTFEKLENFMVFLSNHFRTDWKKDNLGLLADQLLRALMSRHQGKMVMCNFVNVKQ